ncbi:hypothetical protein SGMN_30000 [Stenotrophomonas geniculata]
MRIALDAMQRCTKRTAGPSAIQAWRAYLEAAGGPATGYNQRATRWEKRNTAAEGATPVIAQARYHP